jgi:hypothetical protein
MPDKPEKPRDAPPKPAEKPGGRAVENDDHDPDSDPPRTAVPPGTPDKERGGRQESCD